MESTNWTWGLSLIALTVAIHTMAVVIMSLIGFRIRAKLDTRSLGLRHVIPIVTGVVGTVGLLLAIFHAMEAAIWQRRICGSVRSTRLTMRSSIPSTR